MRKRIRTVSNMVVVRLVKYISPEEDLVKLPIIIMRRVFPQPLAALLSTKSRCLSGISTVRVVSAIFSPSGSPSSSSLGGTCDGGGAVRITLDGSGQNADVDIIAAPASASRCPLTRLLRWDFAEDKPSSIFFLFLTFIRELIKRILTTVRRMHGVIFRTTL